MTSAQKMFALFVFQIESGQRNPDGSMKEDPAHPNKKEEISVSEWGRQYVAYVNQQKGLQFAERQKLILAEIAMFEKGCAAQRTVWNLKNEPIKTVRPAVPSDLAQRIHMRHRSGNGGR